MTDIESALTGQFSRDPQLSLHPGGRKIPRRSNPAPSKVPRDQSRNTNPATPRSAKIAPKPRVQAVEAPIAPAVIQAVKLDIAGVKDSWDQYQFNDSRYSIYSYLDAVFQTLTKWRKQKRAKRNARLALKLQFNRIKLKMDPFTVVLYCTSEKARSCSKTRSKWARALRAAARFKGPNQSIRDFIRGRGGINNCAALFCKLDK
jgi:hypothetical protein